MEQVGIPIEKNGCKLIVMNKCQASSSESEVRPEDMGDEVFRVLRFSYTCLNDWALQQCFLYCALFPEDHEIDREKLIEILISEGIIERRMSRQMDFDKGHAMLNKLVKVSLLEDVRKRGGARYIKMHDLMRDMAIQIIRECSPSIIETGRQLKHVPEEKYWTKDTVRVSLISNDINEIPSNYSPVCSRLSTLLLSQNRMLKSIPDSFFRQFHGLKVLDLSTTGIKKLPESVGCLGNLKALLFRRCLKLCHMPSLVKHLSLEILDLSFCTAIKLVPEVLESLSNLTFLNLFETDLKKLQSGMLTGLSHLQFLAFKRHLDTSFGVKAEELAALQKLESLNWWFHDFGEYNKYVQLVYKMQSVTVPINYFLHVGWGGRRESTKYADKPSSREVNFHSCDIGRELFIQKDLQILRMIGVTIYDGTGLCLKTASEMSSFETELKSLSIACCTGIEYMFHLSSSPSIFQNLETLELFYLPSLCAVFGNEEVTPTAMPLLPCATTFSCLKQLCVTDCKTMKKLFPPGFLFNLKNLEEIVVEYCSAMEEIIAAAEDEASYRYHHSNLTETQFNLPKLRCLRLIRLPKLRSIFSAQIVCDSYLEITIKSCMELKRIPISFSQQSVQTLCLRIWPQEWWEAVEWGDPDQKNFLRPQFGPYKD